MASHGGGPTNLNMLLAMPNAIYMETGSLRGENASLEPLQMEDGEILAPESPGMGDERRADRIRRYKIG